MRADTHIGNLRPAWRPVNEYRKRLKNGVKRSVLIGVKNDANPTKTYKAVPRNRRARKANETDTSYEKIEWESSKDLQRSKNHSFRSYETRGKQHMMKSNYKHCHSKQAMIETNEMKIFREKSSVKNKMQQNKIDRWKAEEESPMVKNGSGVGLGRSSSNPRFLSFGRIKPSVDPAGKVRRTERLSNLDRQSGFLV
ncbi:hypothetical protein RUM44_000216 [Polyplax serrata]|uniref:Uncharacterized protein n=1 Tax=Polyplax serrata TaxID=468196 RepID=A0ABR1B4T2_POLSC